MTCPLCNEPLTIFYSLNLGEMVVKCDHEECVLCKNKIRATADRSADAMDRFNGLALKFEKR